MFEDDEKVVNYSLSPKIRLQKYINSKSVYHKFHCTKCILECLPVCKFEFVQDTIMDSIEVLLKSNELSVIDSMLSTIPELAENLYEYFPEDATSLIIDDLLPILHDVCFDAKADLCVSIAESYSSVLTLLEQEDFKDNELQILQKMSLSDKKETRYIVSHVLSCLVLYFESSIWFSQLLGILTTLSSDENSSLRALVPSLIASYSKRLFTPKDQALLSGRFPLFCRDPVASVRKSAADSIVSLSESLDDNTRLIIIRPAAQTLMSDPSEEVNISIQKNLGPLVATFGPKADISMVIKYCQTMVSSNATTAYYSAYSFPAVALALGKERWNEIKPSFEMACSSRQVNIRRTLSYGIVCYGQVMDQLDLESAVSSFLNDTPSVAVGVISGMHQIVGFLNNKDILQNGLQDPQQKFQDWRIRLRVSEQLRYCSEFFDRRVLMRSAKELIQDDCATVRKDALMSFAHLMDTNDTSYLKYLTESDNHFIRICAALVFSYAGFDIISRSIELLKKLSRDPVPNVRIAAASSIIMISGSTDSPVAVNDLLVELKKDKDPDVRKVIESKEL